MSFDLPIFLDSSKTTQPSHNFTIRLDQPIMFDQPHEVALTHLNTWYSFFNITTAKANNEFRYTSNGTDWNVITIIDGNYSVFDVIDYLRNKVNEIEENEDAFDTNIIMNPNLNTLKFEITLKDDYKIDLTWKNLYVLLGYYPQILEAGTHISEHNVNITDNVNSVILHASICDGMSLSNNIQSSRIFEFVPNSPPGSSLSFEVQQPLYIGVNKNRVDQIQIRLTDNNDRELSLNGEPLSCILHLRPRKLQNKY